MATSSATRQQGRGAWNRAERQAAQGAHPLKTLSESDDAVSDQGHTSSVPESGTSMMGRGGAPKRGGPGRSVPVKTRTPTAVKNSFQHLDNSENETSGDEAMGAESESCQEEEVVMMSGGGINEPSPEDEQEGDHSSQGDEEGDRRRMEVEDEMKEEKEEIKDEPEGDKANSYAGEGPNEEAMPPRSRRTGVISARGRALRRRVMAKRPLCLPCLEETSRGHNTWPP